MREVEESVRKHTKAKRTANRCSKAKILPVLLEEHIAWYGAEVEVKAYGLILVHLDYKSAGKRKHKEVSPIVFLQELAISKGERVK